MSQVIKAIRAAQLTCEARSSSVGPGWWFPVYARLIAAVREQVYEEQLTRMFFNLIADCESFVAELSESTKNRDLWTMSEAGVKL